MRDDNPIKRKSRSRISNLLVKRSQFLSLEKGFKKKGLRLT